MAGFSHSIFHFTFLDAVIVSASTCVTNGYSPMQPTESQVSVFHGCLIVPAVLANIGVRRRHQCKDLINWSMDSDWGPWFENLHAWPNTSSSCICHAMQATQCAGNVLHTVLGKNCCCQNTSEISEMHIPPQLHTEASQCALLSSQHTSPLWC